MRTRCSTSSPSTAASVSPPARPSTTTPPSTAPSPSRPAPASPWATPSTSARPSPNPAAGTAALKFGNNTVPRFTLGWGNMVPRTGRLKFETEIGIEYIGDPPVSWNITGGGLRHHHQRLHRYSRPRPVARPCRPGRHRPGEDQRAGETDIERPEGLSPLSLHRPQLQALLRHAAFSGILRPTTPVPHRFLTDAGLFAEVISGSTSLDPSASQIFPHSRLKLMSRSPLARSGPCSQIPPFTLPLASCSP